MSNDEYSFTTEPGSMAGDDSVTFGGDGGWTLAESRNVRREGGAIVPAVGLPDSESYWYDGTPTPPESWTVSGQTRVHLTVENAPAGFRQDETALQMQMRSPNYSQTHSWTSPETDLSGYDTLVCQIEMDNTTGRSDGGNYVEMEINGNRVFREDVPGGGFSWTTYTFDVSSYGSASTISWIANVGNTTHDGTTTGRLGDLSLE